MIGATSAAVVVCWSRDRDLDLASLSGRGREACERSDQLLRSSHLEQVDWHTVLGQIEREPTRERGVPPPWKQRHI